MSRALVRNPTKHNTRAMKRELANVNDIFRASPGVAKLQRSYIQRGAWNRYTARFYFSPHKPIAPIHLINQNVTSPNSNKANKSIKATTLSIVITFITDLSIVITFITEEPL